MSKKLSLPETIKQAADELRQGVYSAVELTQAYLHQIEAVEPDVHAIITVTADKALDQAREADARIATGSANMLTGIPLIHKVQQELSPAQSTTAYD